MTYLEQLNMEVAQAIEQREQTKRNFAYIEMMVDKLIDMLKNDAPVEEHDEWMREFRDMCTFQEI